MKAIPVIKVTPVLDGGRPTRIKFWCPFCKSWHFHGLPLGHRRSHCWSPRSPYRISGYFLTFDEEVIPGAKSSR